jgi:hypothetical protein
MFMTSIGTILAYEEQRRSQTTALLADCGWSTDTGVWFLVARLLSAWRSRSRAYRAETIAAADGDFPHAIIAWRSVIHTANYTPPSNTMPLSDKASTSLTYLIPFQPRAHFLGFPVFAALSLINSPPTKGASLCPRYLREKKIQHSIIKVLIE